VRGICFSFALLANAVLAYSQSGPPRPTVFQPWPEEPTEFRGIKFGSTESQARAVANIQQCRDVRSDRFCVWAVPVKDFSFTVFLIFVDGKFASATGTFPQDRFADVRSLFVRTYGRPHTSAAMEMQYQEIGWMGKGAEVSLKATGGPEGSGHFSVETAEYSKKSMRDQDAKQAGRK